MTTDTTPHDTAPQAAPRAHLAGKYMTFRLATEEYGIEILKVRELIGLMEITRVPGTRPFIRGVINLRGKVIPVVDLRLHFGLEPAENVSQAVIIVVQLTSRDGHHTMGILVDEVLEVRAIDAKDIEPPPDFNAHENVEYILGVGKAERRIIFLLDIDRVLTPEERQAVVSTH